MDNAVYVIAGIDGWIASEVAGSFLEQGRRVVGIGRRPKERRASISQFIEAYLTVEQVASNGFEDLGREIVFVNLINVFSRSEEISTVRRMIRSNAVDAMTLAENIPPSQLFINVGSIWQSGNPSCPYSRSKNLLVDYLRLRTDLRRVTIFVPDVVGERDTRGKVLSQMIESCRNRTELAITGGEQLVELVHVEQVIEGIEWAIAKDGELNYHECQIEGSPISLEELAELVSVVDGRPTMIKFAGECSDLERTDLWRFAEPCRTSFQSNEQIVQRLYRGNMRGSHPRIHL